MRVACLGAIQNMSYEMYEAFESELQLNDTKFVNELLAQGL